MIDLSTICWDAMLPKLVRRREVSRTAGGMTLAKDLGPALWRVSATSHPLPLGGADALYAQLLSAEPDTVLIRGNNFNWQREHKGALDGVTVAAVTGDRMMVAGLPVVLGVGARVSVETERGYEFFQTLDATDMGGGFRVVPDMRGVASGMALHVTPPLLEVSIDPGTVDIQRDSRMRRRVSFSGTQVIR